LPVVPALLGAPALPGAPALAAPPPPIAPIGALPLLPADAAGALPAAPFPLPAGAFVLEEQPKMEAENETKQASSRMRIKRAG
ncbi:MAG TPA: hypothetical protein VGJ91_08410, partial [Polyangiaceae bacterium]